MDENKIKVGIVGGSGWTGVELLRLLLQHPKVEVIAITSRSLNTTLVTDLFPNLLGQTNLVFSLPEVENLLGCALVFFATPHGVAMNTAPKLLEKGIRVIDLGADFRLDDIEVWQSFYGMEHTQIDWVKKAVYGLTEYNRSAIKTAQLVANPGCYPTAVSLGLKPLLEASCLKLDNIIADCKSGVSGAGREANAATGFCEVGETFKSYNISGHRHLPEIEQVLNTKTNTDVGLTFIPHLVPMIRGMQATIYVDLSSKMTIESVHKLFKKTYEYEPFVQILALGKIPETRFVKTSNYCQIGLQLLNNGKKLVIILVLDNLIKGASGQAVQNMNIMLDFPETMGLTSIAIMP